MIPDNWLLKIIIDDISIYFYFVIKEEKEERKKQRKKERKKEREWRKK